MVMAKDQRAQLDRASKVLLGLLRSPKTREGLRAAVADEGLKPNFLRGWLALQVHSKAIVRQVIDGRVHYVVAGAQSDAKVGSIYPAWLDPSAAQLPPYIEYTTHTCGTAAVEDPE